MASIDQYLQIFRDNRATIDANSAAPLNRLRDDAARHLAVTPLPRKGDENFENIDLEELLAPDFGINIVEPHRRMPSSTVQLPEGVETGSLKEFAIREPQTVTQFYGKAADLSNPIAALDTLLAEDGNYLRIKRGTVIDKPLQIVNLLTGSRPMMDVRRLLVIVEEGASAKLLMCDHTSEKDVAHLSLETIEIFVAENARFDYYNIEESTQATTRLSALYARQSAGSQLNIDGITLYNGTTRNEYYCRFEGENAALRLYGMGIEDKKRVLSTYTRIDHNVARCMSDELFKFSVDDEAQGAFTGRIYVAEGAVKTEAYQANRNLLGSDTAKMFSKPQLEIYNDDVKCSHGCAIGQLDPMQLFYMRTRGLDEDTAKLLLRQAFMSDVIAAIDNDRLRDRLHILTEKRFAGQEAACEACKGM